MLSRKEPVIEEYVTVNDTFGKSATLAELLKEYRIDSDAVSGGEENYGKRIFFEIEF